MNIMLALNDAIVSGALCVLCSTMKHNKNVNWYILTMDIDMKYPTEPEVTRYTAIRDYKRKLMRRIVKYFDSNSNITFIDARQYYDKYLANSPNWCSGFTPYAPLRLLTGKILPHLDHLLYLDCDTIVCKNLEPYYNKYCFTDHEYAAYRIPEACDMRGEMISGVLFMNLKKCRETGFFDRAIYNYCHNEYLYPDQMAIRDTCEPLDIEETLNYMRNLETCLTDPVIIHFSSELELKIYQTDWVVFFRRYPQFKYIDQYIEIIDGLPHMSCDNQDDYV